MVFGIGHVNGALAIRHGMRGVAYISVEGLLGIGTWSVERELAVFVKIEILRFGFVRRPGIEFCPGIAAGLEEQSFFEREAALVFQPVGKPRRFDVAPKIKSGIAAKRDEPEGVACAAGPA